MSGSVERRWLWAGAIACAAIGLALRIVHLFAMPLWLDEAYSAYAAGHGLAFLWRVVPYYETHPPFYYTLLAGWERTFGDGLVSLRASSLIAGLAALPLLAASGRAIGDVLGRDARASAHLAFAAFAFGCVSSALVEMTREVRPYALMILVYAAAIRALVAILARRQAGRGLAGGAYALYLGCTALLLWLHNLGGLWAAALGIALLLAAIDRRTTRADLAWIVAGHVLVLLLWLPALRILLDQAPTWAASTWVRFSFATMWPRLGTIYAVPNIWSVAALLLAGLGIALAWRSGAGRSGTGRRLAAMLLVLALLPVLLSVVLTLTVAPVFITRTLTPAAVPALLLLAIGATGRPRPLGWVGAGAALLLVANMAAIGVQNRTFEPQRQDWYGTIAWLRPQFRAGDQILAYPNEGALPMRRALADEGLSWPVRAIPADVPAIGWGDWHPTGNRGVVSLRRPVLRAIARAPATQTVPTIWLLRLGRETYDPGDAFLLELHAGRRIVRSWADGPISVVGLERIGPVRRAPARTRDTTAPNG